MEMMKFSGKIEKAVNLNWNFVCQQNLVQRRQCDWTRHASETRNEENAFGICWEIVG
jgi:hypothetical protein